MRHELKYILNPIQYQVLKDRLKWFMEPDPNGDADSEYFIRSIYFDTPNRDAFWEKIDGVDRRRKYRIRFYNLDTEHCTLECKEKKGTMIQKIAEPLSREEARLLLDSGRVMADGAFSGRMALYVKEAGLYPAVCVDYVREAYIYPVSDVRITFDKSLSAGAVENSLLAERGFANIMGERMILEVKYNEVLPLHISELIAAVQPSQMAVSKYVLCMEHQLWTI